MNPYRPVLACLVLAAILTVPVQIAVAQSCIGMVCLPGNPGDAMVGITVADAVASESGADTTLTFTVHRTDGLSDVSGLTVTLSYTGSATINDDYTTSNPTTVTIPAGSESATVTVTAVADGFSAEPSETVVVKVVDTGAYTVAQPPRDKATGTINNVAPSTVTVTASDATASEAGSNTGAFTVSRSNPINENLVVNIELGGTATRPADYQADATTTVTIPGGQSQVTVLITPASDSLQEAVETVTLTIKASGTTGTTYSVGSPSVATVNILDGNLPVVALTASDAAASETPTSTVSTNDGTFVFTRGSTGGSLDVTFAVSGTATRGSGSDYTLLIGSTTFTTNTVTFPSGSSTVSVTLRPVDDAVAEGAEVATLTLMDGSAYQASPTERTASVTIEDNDVPVVTVAASKTRAVEPSDSITLTFARTAPASVTLTTMDVVLDVSPSSTMTLRYSGTATADASFSGLDRTGSTTSIRFVGTAPTAVATFTVIDDTSPEATESVVLTISPSTAAPPTYGAGSPGTVTLSIADNDVADTDADTIADNVDNCPSVANKDQANADADAQGDACDADDDNDGLSDTQEATLGTNPKASDTDADERSDKAEVDAGTDPLSALSPDFRPAAASITAKVTDGGIQINWTAPAGSKVSRYLVFRASDPVLVASVTGTSSTTSYTAKDTTYPGGEHRYYVQAMLPLQYAKDAVGFNSSLAVAGPTIDAAVCDVFKLDSDGDGLCDAAEDKNRNGEVDEGETDPFKADTDGDGLLDGEDSDPLTARTVGGGTTKFSNEPLVWVGLLIALAAVVLLVVGFAWAARKPEPEPVEQL